MTRPIYEPSTQRQISSQGYADRQLLRRPGIPPGGGLAIFEIKVFEDDVIVAAGDGAFKFDIPEDLDTSDLVKVEAWITGVSSSGDVVVTFYNNTQSLEMLSDDAIIEVGELNTKDATNPPVVNPANATVAWGDEIWVNVDNAGTGALGLGVAVYFAPSESASIVLQGAQGPAGGMTSYQGQWTTTTNYNAGDIVTNNQTVYIATADHTSSATDEPGVGVNWEDFWATLVDLPMLSGVSVCITANYPIQDGIKAMVVMPFDATLIQAQLLADAAGDAVVDIWKSDFGGYPPNSGDSITSATPPTLTASIKNSDSTLTGWTTSLLEGDILVVSVSGVTVITRLTLFLKFEKG